MGFWAKWQYEQYVENHHQGFERNELLGQRTEVLDDKYHNIVIGYDAMSSWMSRNSIITLDEPLTNRNKNASQENEAHFGLLLHAYRADRQRYKDEVKGWFPQISARRTGRALLKEIVSSDFRLRIVPYHGQDDNATTEREDTRIEEGVAANAKVRFTPGLHTGKAMLGPANAPDEVLFHEMVHASRMMIGKDKSVRVDHNYTDTEEYLAIVISNIYISEKGQTTFAADHLDKTMNSEEAKSWLKNTQNINISPDTLLEKFRDRQPQFYWDLAHLPIPPVINWVREYNELKGYT